MISFDRFEGESLVIEDGQKGIQYRVVIEKVFDGETARIGIEAFGPAVLESDSTLAVENDGRPLHLRLG